MQQGALEQLVKILQTPMPSADQPPRMNGSVRNRAGPSTKVLEVQGSDLSYSLSRPYEKHSMRTLAASALAVLLQDPPHQTQVSCAFPMSAGLLPGPPHQTWARPALLHWLLGCRILPFRLT